jgi:hypothetical protein
VTNPPTNSLTKSVTNIVPKNVIAGAGRGGRGALNHQIIKDMVMSHFPKIRHAIPKITKSDTNLSGTGFWIAGFGWELGDVRHGRDIVFCI